MKTLARFAAAFVLLGASVTASALSLELVTDNTRSSSGTLSYQVFKTCAPAVGNGCIDPANPWVVANGVTGSTATWTWDGNTLAATGLYWSTSYIGSNPSGSSVVSDKTTNLVIDTGAGDTSATTYNCIEGTFLAAVGANGCLSTSTGANSVNESTGVYNIGGNANCTNRILGGDDVSTGPMRGISSAGDCAPTAGAYNLWTIVTDNTGTGGQLILSNGINIASANTHYLTFNVVPVPAAAWLFGSAVGLFGVARRRGATAA